MVKSRPAMGSELEVWPEKYISAYDRGEYGVLPDRYKNAEIVQIEHAYEDKFLVEVIRPRQIQNSTIVMPKELIDNAFDPYDRIKRNNYRG